MGLLARARVDVHRQRGIIVVEFALALPVLLMMLLAIVELGRLLYVYDTLTKAVENGARYMASHAATPVGVPVLEENDIDVARNLVVFGSIGNTGEPLIPDLTPGNINVTCTYGVAGGAGRCAADASGIAAITVSATYRFMPIVGNALQQLTGINLAMPLQATVVKAAL